MKDIWGLYANDPKKYLYSAGINVGVILDPARSDFQLPAVQKLVKQKFDLIDPNLKPFVPDVKPKPAAMQGGGGGGAREPLPVTKGGSPSLR